MQAIRRRLSTRLLRRLERRVQRFLLSGFGIRRIWRDNRILRVGQEPENSKTEDKPQLSPTASHEFRGTGILRVEQGRASVVPEFHLRSALRGGADREIGRWKARAMVQRGFVERIGGRDCLYSQYTRPYARSNQLFLCPQVIWYRNKFIYERINYNRNSIKNVYYIKLYILYYILFWT